jgi:peptidoglycan hydrolase-like protein with peptidoglycan-binding domain
MPAVIPFVPQNITVHLGTPTSDAANVTVSFADYVKNVASSEIYPTWEESALRANILAITSFALNRIYTEYYRSRGYDFDITNSTAFDQAFVNGRSIFENISRLVDDLFNDYLRRPEFVEPLAAKFCNGTTVTCEGLSQWGSQNLALEGYNSIEILRSYYGDVETVVNAPIRGNRSSYPGTPLRVGSTGPNVVVIQASLNRISQNYPAIPKVPVADGIFGSKTEASVKAFQKIFDLTPDGIVGQNTWYALVRIYTAVTKLSELRSQGQQFYSISWAPPNALQLGDTGEKVKLLQYMLAMLSEYIPEIPPVAVDGIYGKATRAAVLAAQRRFRLPETGVVDPETWQAIYGQFSGIENTTLRSEESFPVSGTMTPAAVPAGNFTRFGTDFGSKTLYARSSTLQQFPGRDLSIGSRDAVQKEVVR